MLLSAICFSCNSESENPRSSESVYFENASLETETFAQVKSGHSLVFKSTVNYDVPEFIDEEYSEHFFFEVDPSEGAEFLIESEDLNNSNSFYNKSCYCPLVLKYKYKSGSIKGKKIAANKWKVNIDLLLEKGYENYVDDKLDTLYQDYPLKLSEIFYLDKL